MTTGWHHAFTGPHEEAGAVGNSNRFIGPSRNTASPFVEKWNPVQGARLYVTARIWVGLYPVELCWIRTAQ
jgi:hypothetical protein